MNTGNIDFVTIINSAYLFLGIMLLAIIGIVLISFKVDKMPKKSGRSTKKSRKW